ncbi:MAG: DUF3592 domain-containing protein [Archangium sp.]|nr:DUF3592 domain-containing protein [Archangium sp.]MDP3151594.1 DUF3592 domain-containing protein [Archangium sp.]MDP3569129.1 DUF3592 domain-containing protein [Archangium sp.]
MTNGSEDRFLPLIPAGLGLVLLIMATTFGSIGRYQQKKSQALLTWPSVEGTVTSSGISRYRLSGETQDREHAVATFAYEVEGKRYEFTRTYGGGRFVYENAPPSLEWAEGQKVPIYFDPNDPSDRELSRTRDDTELLFLGIGIFCGLLSLPFFYGAWRWNRSQRLASATR